MQINKFPKSNGNSNDPEYSQKYFETPRQMLKTLLILRFVINLQ